MLIGGDECLVWITTSVTIAYNAIVLYAQIDPTIYLKLGITKNELDLIYANWLVYSDGYLLATTVSW